MSRLLLALLGSLPLVALAAHPIAPGNPIEGALDAWFSLHCHQDPQRTVAPGGQLFPVCARCTGLYLGLLAGALAPGMGALSRRWLGALAVGAALLALDVATQALGLRVSSLGTRLVTGLLLAYPAARLALGGSPASAAPPEPAARPRP